MVCFSTQSSSPLAHGKNEKKMHPPETQPSPICLLDGIPGFVRENKGVTCFSCAKKTVPIFSRPCEKSPSQFSALRKKPVTIVSPTKKTRHNFQPYEKKPVTIFSPTKKNRSHLGQGHARPKCDWFSGKPVAISNAKCKVIIISKRGHRSKCDRFQLRTQNRDRFSGKPVGFSGDPPPAQT